MNIKLTKNKVFFIFFQSEISKILISIIPIPALELVRIMDMNRHINIKITINFSIKYFVFRVAAKQNGKTILSHDEA